MTPDLHTWPLPDTVYSTQYIKSIYTYNVSLHGYMYMNISDSLLTTVRFIQINISDNKCCLPLYSLGYLSKLHFRLFISFPLSYLISEGNPVIGSAVR